MNKFKIAVDGPAGAGKSTIAKILAGALGYIYVDTGAMYRAVTLKALRLGMNLDDVQAVEEMARNTSVHLELDPGSNQQVFLDGQEVTLDIREPVVSQNVSKVAAMVGVRERLVGLQRLMGQKGGVVMDGRDICSHVLPDAEFKFFMTASLKERAHRRFLELKEKGHHIDLGQMEQEIAQRDKLDSERDASPLAQAPDAILIETSDLNIDQVVALMLSKIKVK